MFKSNGGFTLVELIVVIAILAILAGVAIPAYTGYIEKAQAVEGQLEDHKETIDYLAESVWKEAGYSDWDDTTID